MDQLRVAVRANPPDWLRAAMVGAVGFEPTTPPV
jgi:hypothetical protein